MKQKYFFILCLLSVVLSFVACSKDRDEEKTEELNTTGAAFMERVMERENWQREWEVIEKLGTPLPNRSRMNKDYCILPVKVRKDTFYAIYYPLEKDKDNDTHKFGTPMYSGETCSEGELFEQKFEVEKKDWEETEPRVSIIEIRN